MQYTPVIGEANTQSVLPPGMSDDALASFATSNFAQMARALTPMYIFSVYPHERDDIQEALRFVDKVVDGQVLKEPRQSRKRVYCPAIMDREKVAWLRFDTVSIGQRVVGNDLNSEDSHRLFNGVPELKQISAQSLVEDFHKRWYIEAFSNLRYHPGAIIVDGKDLPENFNNITRSMPGKDKETTSPYGIISFDDLYKLSTKVYERMKEAAEEQLALAQELIANCSKAFSAGNIDYINEKPLKIIEWAIGKDRLSTYPWASPNMQQEVKKCMACSKQISQEALVCEYCRTDLVDFYVYKQEKGLESILTDSFIANLLAEARKPKIPQQGNLKK